MNFEGTTNATTITCNIINSSRSQEITAWSISNFRGLFNNFHVLRDDTAPEIFLFTSDPLISGAPSTAMYRNRLTILVWSNDLGQATIFCGSSTSPAQANYILRIYRE